MTAIFTIPANYPNFAKMVSLSIVLPCYNPDLDWQNKVLTSFENIRAQFEDIELIIVNDGSTIDLKTSFDYLKENIAELVVVQYDKNQGKGHAVREGIRVAKNNFIIYTDLDFPYTVESFYKISNMLTTEKYDIVVGVKDEKYYAKVPAIRKVISKALMQMIRRFTGLQITDTQCGLKGITGKGKALLLDGKINRYLFDLELIYRAEKEKLSIIVVPVTLREGVLFSPVRWEILMREFLNFLKILKQ